LIELATQVSGFAENAQTKKRRFAINNLPRLMFMGRGSDPALRKFLCSTHKLGTAFMASIPLGRVIELERLAE
jgi:hypothetical protein